MAVYVDVLIAVNFAIDYLMIKAAAIFCGANPKQIRLIASAALGALSSLIIFFPPSTASAEFVFRFISAAAICAAAFCPCPKQAFLKSLFGFLAASFLFSGAVLLWQITAKPMGVISCAGAVYFDIGVPALILCSVMGYAAACLLSRILMLKLPNETICKITVINNGASASVTTLIDSGSSLVEPFSNAPVIVCERAALGKVLPAALAAGKSIRFVPYKTLDSNGLLEAFLPEKLMIETENGKCFFTENCYVAVAERISAEQFKAVCNPRIFSNIKSGDDICVN